VRAVWDQPNEDNVVRSAKRYDPGADVRRVSIDKKDHGAFIGKFLTKIIDSHKNTISIQLINNVSVINVFGDVLIV
jgi:hypothetical protein